MKRNCKVAGVTILFCGQSLNICPGCCGMKVEKLKIIGADILSKAEIDSHLVDFKDRFFQYEDIDIEENIRFFKVSNEKNYGNAKYIVVFNKKIFNKIGNDNVLRHVRMLVKKDLFYLILFSDKDHGYDLSTEEEVNKYNFKKDEYTENTYKFCFDGVDEGEM